MRVLEFYHTQTESGFDIAARSSALENELINSVVKISQFVPQASREPHPPRIVYRKIKDGSICMITHCKKIPAYNYLTDQRDGNYILHGAIIDANNEFNLCEFIQTFPWSNGISQSESDNLNKNIILPDRHFDEETKYIDNFSLNTFLTSTDTSKRALIFLLKLILDGNNKYIYIKSSAHESGKWILSAFYLLPKYYTKSLNFAINTIDLREAFNLMEVHDRELLPDNCNVDTLNFNTDYSIENIYLLQYIEQKIEENQIDQIRNFNNLLLELDYKEDPGRLCEILLNSRSSISDFINILNYQTNGAKKKILLKYIIQSKLRNLNELFTEHFKSTPTIVKEYLPSCNKEEKEIIITCIVNSSFDQKLSLINKYDEHFSEIFIKEDFWSESFLQNLYEFTITSNFSNIVEMKRILTYLKKIINPKGYIKPYIKRFEQIEKSNTLELKSELKDLFKEIVKNDFIELEFDKKVEAIAILLSRVIKKVWLSIDWNWLYEILYEKDNILYWNALCHFLENYKKKNENYHEKNWLIDKLIESYSDKQSMLNELQENLKLSYQDRDRINYNLRELALPEIRFD